MTESMTRILGEEGGVAVLPSLPLNQPQLKVLLVAKGGADVAFGPTADNLYTGDYPIRLPAYLVYGSTTGVYGDRQGQWTSETTPPNPQTARAQRRVDAEQHLRWMGRATGVRVSVLRIPGIYAPDREGGTPRERLLRGTPALLPQDDVYTNHIHANDLARACIAALWRAAPQRIYNVCDDSDLSMGEYFDLAAELFGLPKPERISRAEAQQRLSPMLLSFMSESRRLSNQRMKQELGLRLWYPKVEDGLRS
jgi:nucleoside-diphosphate-sugar epimerase